MKHRLFSIALAWLPAAAFAAATPAQTAPHDGMIKVAFAISGHVNVMDIAGPWEVFADTSLKDAQGKEIAPYDIYTVSSSKTPLHSEGGIRPGLTITPDFDFAHAPVPDIVVVPAQQGSKELQAWLKQLHARHITIMSVCTGAMQLAHAGLLDGKPATTHHWYFGDVEREYPKVKWVKQVRYVQSDPITFTAGGLTSGVDLALHMVATRFGQDVAEQTANFMEYLGTGWKTNQGIAPMSLPVTKQDWSGEIDGKTPIVLHQVTYGASPVFRFDLPAQNLAQVPATLSQKGAHVNFSIAIPRHPATIAAQATADAATITGTFTQDGRSLPLTLLKKPLSP